MRTAAQSAPFSPQPQPFEPVALRKDRAEWRADLGEQKDIGEVVIPYGQKREGLVVEFSNDDFAADVRPAAEGVGSERVLGPIDKSFFRTERIVTFNGQPARYLRLKLPTGVAPKGLEILSKPLAPPVIVQMTPCDMVAGDGQTELLCRTGDGQLAVVSTAGKLLWKEDFPHKILATAALDIDETDRRHVLVADSASNLWRFSPDGRQIEKSLLKTGTNTDQDFFRFNRPYCFGIWKPDKDQKPDLIMGTYQSVIWRKADGELVCFDRNSADPNRNGFVWRGLVYWDRVLDRGLDVDGDGIEDQALLSRGWGWEDIATLLFFSGRTHDALAEYKFPSSRTLGLEAVELGGRKCVLAANEFKMALFSPDAKELWSVRFDTPAADYAVAANAVFVAKRGGMVLKLGADGKILKTQVLVPELRSIAAGKFVVVSGDGGLFCLDSDLEVKGCLPASVRLLAPAGDGAFAAAFTDGSVRIMEPQE